MNQRMYVEEMTELVAKHGFTVFPLYGIDSSTGTCTCFLGESCSSPGKHPCVESWKAQSPMKTKEEVSAFFERNLTSGRNFGLKTGQRSKDNGMFLYVLDLDTEDAESQLTKSEPKLQQTVQYRTGNGKHYWLWSRFPVKSAVGTRQNIDIRGTGAYVVIPPSVHRKGVGYGTGTSLWNKEIFHLEPSEVLGRGNTPPQFKTILQKQLGALALNCSRKSFSWWTTSEVKEIRHHLEQRNKKIPVGARNTVLHRLLSSDRAQGIINKQDLVENLSRYVRQYCVEPIEETEQENIVNSVMKYPAYNNKEEKVLEIYAKWRLAGNKNRNQQLEIKQEILGLEKADRNYFLGLKKTAVQSEFSSLKSIQEHRRKTLQNLGFHDIHEYKPSLLGQRLKKFGFERLKTRDCNLWNVKLA